jgi:murein DD-endopeptidase MepM/ murein hydrolase activator NlpD
MQKYVLTRMPAQRRASPLPWILAAVIPVLCIVLAVSVRACRHRKPVVAAPPPVPTVPPKPVPVYPWREIRSPTARRLVPLDTIAETFQSTGSGRAESGMYGSVRTTDRGGHTLSSFHEGIDIAAVTRSRNGMPQDAVFAIAGGEVGYANRIAGNSNYGKYVVLLHKDPIGTVYSLYAHLSEVDAAVQPGAAVQAGTLLGVMGNTSTAGIPPERGHLHLEIGLINNIRFAEWYRAQKLTPDHGNFNGQNFLGINPLEFYLAQYADPTVHFGAFLKTVPVAFEVVMRPRQQLDFFRRYGALWNGPYAAGGAILVSCSENGLPLQGRLATDEEASALRSSEILIRNVKDEALGRNGCHLITHSSGQWAIGTSGRKWLDVLTYGSGLVPGSTGTRDAAPGSTRSGTRRR